MYSLLGKCRKHFNPHIFVIDTVSWKQVYRILKIKSNYKQISMKYHNFSKMNENFITISWIAPINLANPTSFILHICEYCNPTFILCYKSYMVLNKTIQAKIAWQITFLKCHCHCCCATSIIIYSHCQRLKMQYNKQKVILSFFSSQKQILTKILYFQTILNKYKDVCSISKCIHMIFVAYFCKILSCETINNINNSFKMYSEMHFYIFRNNLCLHFYSFFIFHCIWKYDLLRKISLNIL